MPDKQGEAMFVLFENMKRAHEAGARAFAPSSKWRRTVASCNTSSSTPTPSWLRSMKTR